MQLITDAKEMKVRSYILIPLTVTLLYWYWESVAWGNIRVDLLVIYPTLFLIYIASLWRRYKFYALLISMILMAMNICFLLISYDLFDKYPG
jgi:hypothetical protein